MPAGHIIIDGFNVVHAWPELRSLLGRNLDAAESRLLDAVRILHDFEGHALTIVFDGQGGTLSITNPDADDGLTIVHSASGTTADTVIARLLVRAPSTEGWAVASADAAVAQAATAAGARAISPQMLAQWCEQLERRQRHWIARQQTESDPGKSTRAP